MESAVPVPVGKQTEKTQQNVNPKSLKRGFIIDNRFKIESQIGLGGFGVVYSAFDLQENTQVVVKVNDSHQVNKHEAEIIAKLNNKGFKGFANLIAWGNQDEYNIYYIVMQKLGSSLKAIIKTLDLPCFSLKTVVQIGLQLIERLKDLHSIDYIHLDIKPDNLLLQSSNLNSPESSIIHIIDFGISKPYMLNQQHIPMRHNIPFQGNYFFASKNCFLNSEQSRRDDFISVALLLCYLIEGKIQYIGRLKLSDPQFFQKMTIIKQNLTPQKLCKRQASKLLRFVEEIFSYEFDQAPNYSKLRHLLVCDLLDQNKLPDLEFDWSKFRVPKIRSKDKKELQTDFNSDEINEGSNDVDSLLRIKYNSFKKSKTRSMAPERQKSQYDRRVKSVPKRVFQQLVDSNQQISDISEPGFRIANNNSRKSQGYEASQESNNSHSSNFFVVEGAKSFISSLI